jgi:hypothetical protein
MSAYTVFREFFMQVGNVCFTSVRETKVGSLIEDERPLGTTDSERSTGARASLHAGDLLRLDRQLLRTSTRCRC